MDIAFIAPFERIRVKAQSIIDTSNYPAKTYLGDLYQGVEAAEQALAEGAKIIISRGGTARLIRQQLGIEVIEVGGSIYRTLAIIQDEVTSKNRVAILGFKHVINIVEPICDILNRHYKSFELKDKLSFNSVIEQVEEWKPDVVIGDAISFHWAKTQGLNAHLIESSMETIVDAFERAMLVLKNLKKHITYEKKLLAVLDCTNEGAALVSKNGIIEEINQQGCDILDISGGELPGNSIFEYLTSPELKRVFENKQIARHIIANHKGKKLAIDHITISQDDVYENAAVILFQKIDQIHETGNVLRKKLSGRGFTAKYTFSDIQHISPQMANLVTMAKQYSGTKSNIMIQGETGTGKELFAQSIHNASPFANGPFVAVNCAALSGSLLESELFGYAPGAFTGALRSGKTGLFELAQDGTLFLDEITEMDIFLQSKLLRALQTGEIMRVGDSKMITVNVRIVAATNKQPLEAVKNGNLRADLYYRLNVLDLLIPPLRERNEDSEFLFNYFSETPSTDKKKTPIKPPKEIISFIKNHPWPGNVRELENFSEKYMTLRSLPGSGLQLQANLISTKHHTSIEAETLNDIITSSVLKVYKQENGNISQTARKLGIDRNTVKRWLNKRIDN